MKTISLVLLFATVSLLAADAKSDPLKDVKDERGLPRVLLIGDSISMGYTLPVRELLKGRANVHRPDTNCSSTNEALKNLDEWLGKKKWDVIHFNFGLHDLKYVDERGKMVPAAVGHALNSPEAYARSLRLIVTRLKMTGARLIFATTTPVPGETGTRIQDSELLYNEAALAVMRENGVEIDDLHALAAGRPELQLPRNVHFNDKGCMELAKQVADSVRAALAK